MAKTTSYQRDLIESLTDPCEAAAYLNAAIEEGDRAVCLLALRNVAEACGGMTALAEKTHLSHESLGSTERFCHLSSRSRSKPGIGHVRRKGNLYVLDGAFVVVTRLVLCAPTSRLAESPV